MTKLPEEDTYPIGTHITWYAILFKDGETKRFFNTYVKINSGRWVMVTEAGETAVVTYRPEVTDHPVGSPNIWSF